MNSTNLFNRFGKSLLTVSLMGIATSVSAQVAACLVPQEPSTAPDYYCTWNLQGYITSYGTGAGSNDLRIEINEDNLFGNLFGYKVWGKGKPKATLSNDKPRREVTWTADPRYQGWLSHYPMLHGDLTFVMDDSWDIPRGPGDDGASKRPNGRNYDNPYLATMSIDATRFPSFPGNDQQRMTLLTEAVKKQGWRSLGGWVCAQDPIGLTHEYTGLENTYENSLKWTEEQEERFWKRRLTESEQAGFSYWKVDWGNKDRNEQFRRRLSRWATEVAPHVTIEHASFQDGGPHHPDYIPFSPVIRSYDVNNQIAQAQTLQRLHDLGLQPDAEREGWGIINCEDEPYIAAGLGCAIGVMRHPYVGNLPNGKPDTYFADLGPQSRRLKNRLNEIVRAVRWHRIALPFGHQRDQWLSDTVMLAESGGGRSWQAPARMSRRLPLPEIIGADATSPLRPYVLASLYDNGTTALAIVNRNIEGRYRQQRVDVRLQTKYWDRKIGIFGYCRELTITFDTPLPDTPLYIYGQDLATDEAPTVIAYTRLADGHSIVIKGADLEALCKGHDYPYTEVEREAGKDYTDVSDPAVVLQIVPAQQTAIPHESATQTLYLSGTDKDHRKDWQFYCTDGARSGQWTTIAVPSCWEQEGFGFYNYGHDRPAHNEQGIYRTRFSIPQEWDGRRVYIVFEGVMTDAEVTINGQQAGPVHQGAFYRFKYDITPLINRRQPNDLQVTVSKESANKSINEAERRADYWIFGGIFRPVYLEAQPQSFIDHVAIDARHTGEFRADIWTNHAPGNSQYTADVVILDEEGGQVGHSQLTALSNDSTRLSLQIDDPKAWTSETPHLYTARFNLYSSNLPSGVSARQPIHTYDRKFGFRTIDFRERDGFYVNGVKVKFKGVCRHTFWPESGRTSSKALAIEDVNLIKDMNMNAVRMSHYPPDQFFLDVCDSLGLYVIDELAGWQSAYDSITSIRLAREMVERDVNHPSIVIWSNGNEGGFPKAARPWYGRYDIQQRHVVEPWSRYDGTDTHHYPRYNPARERASRGDVVYMPTESLHGLHDGGHGAGLEDYWEMIRTTPTAAGQFLWDFADEGVVRHDLNDSIDVFNDKAPDGILGPHHEKEGSFFTIKEVWSPVHIEKPQFDTFDGTLSVSNRYHFTNLRDCRFTASLVSFPSPLDSSSKTIRPVSVSQPDVAPWTENATMRLQLPSDWRSSDVLTLTATDPTGRELYTWTWPVSTARQLSDRILPKKLKALKGKRQQAESEHWTKMLNPRLVGISEDKGSIQCTALSDGWLRIDYQLQLDGDYEAVGITMDYPELDVTDATLLADGPYRVWKNRLKGVTYDIHHKTYNNTITGQSWEYPEFKGYYAHFTAMQLHGNTQTLTLVSPTDDIYLRLFTPDKPKHLSRNVDPVFPDGQLSLLVCIPAVGTKFSKAEEEGPQGAKQHFDKKEIKGTAFLMINR